MTDIIEKLNTFPVAYAKDLNLPYEAAEEIAGLRALLESTDSIEVSAFRTALESCKEFLKGGEQRRPNQNPEEDDTYIIFAEGDVDAQLEEIDIVLKGES